MEKLVQCILGRGVEGRAQCGQVLSGNLLLGEADCDKCQDASRRLREGQRTAPTLPTSASDTSSYTLSFEFLELSGSLYSIMFLLLSNPLPAGPIPVTQAGVYCSGKEHYFWS